MAGLLVAHASEMALIQRLTDHGVATSAGPILACVQLGASVRVVTGCSHRRVRIGALAGRSVTCPGNVTLIERRAHARIPPNTCTALADVILRALAAIVAGGTGRLWAIRALAIRTRALRYVALVLRHHAIRVAIAGALSVNAGHRTLLITAPLQALITVVLPANGHSSAGRTLLCSRWSGALVVTAPGGIEVAACIALERALVVTESIAARSAQRGAVTFFARIDGAVAAEAAPRTGAAAGAALAAAAR